MQQRYGVTEMQQLWGSLTAVVNRVYTDPRVSSLMNSRVGLYVSSRPFLGLTVLVFSAMATLPVAVFLGFAFVTTVISTVGFVFLEISLMFVAGGILLSVLSGLALFSVLVASFFNVFYIGTAGVLNYYNPHLAKTENGHATSRVKEVQ